MSPCGEERRALLGYGDFDADTDPLCQCQGCGTWRSVAWLGKAHDCWRNEDGTYEEGGTFQ